MLHIHPGIIKCELGQYTSSTSYLAWTECGTLSMKNHANKHDFGDKIIVLSLFHQFHYHALFNQSDFNSEIINIISFKIRRNK